MPNHADRVAKNYEELCVRCLKRPNREWDNEAMWPHLCEICAWCNHYKRNNILPPRSIEQEVINELGIIYHQKDKGQDVK